MTSVMRLVATDRAVDDVMSLHWHEWGTADAGADREEWRARLVARCGESGIPFTLSARLDGETVGCVTVCTDDADPAFASFGPWISGMVVTGVARNMGIGRVLLTQAADQSRAAGAAELWVWTTEAGAFYERCGYEYVHRKAALRDRSVLRVTL